jgi:hypothetical protein
MCFLRDTNRILIYFLDEIQSVTANGKSKCPWTSLSLERNFFLSLREWLRLHSLCRECILPIHAAGVELSPYWQRQQESLTCQHQPTRTQSATTKKTHWISWLRLALNIHNYCILRQWTNSFSNPLSKFGWTPKTCRMELIVCWLNFHVVPDGFLVYWICER